MIDGDMIEGYLVSLYGVPEKEADYFRRCVSYSLEGLAPELFDEIAADKLKVSLGKMLPRYTVDVDILNQVMKSVSITFIKVEHHDLQGTSGQELREHQVSED